MSIYDLPPHIINTICNINSSGIHNHFVKSQLRSTCKAFSFIANPGHIGAVSRASVWLEYGRVPPGTEDLVPASPQVPQVPHSDLSVASVLTGNISIVSRFCLNRHAKGAILLAAKMGNIEIFRYLHRIGHRLTDKVLIAAAKRSRLEILSYAISIGYILPVRVTRIAAGKGNIAMLRLAIEHGTIDTTNQTCLLALKHHNCLRYAHAAGCVLDDYVVYVGLSIYGTQLLTYLSEIKYPLNSSHGVYAGFEKNAPALIYLYEVGLCDAELLAYFCRYNIVTDYIVEHKLISHGNFLWMAASKGWMDILQMAKEMNCLGTNLISAAAYGGQLECVRFLHENADREADSYRRAAEGAATNGHLLCLSYLRDIGAELTVGAAIGAAYNGHLHCLRYLQESGCPMDHTVVVAAATYGHLDCIQFLHVSGCPIDSGSTLAAMTRGYTDCFMYLHQNGFTFEPMHLIDVLLGDIYYDKPDEATLIFRMLRSDPAMTSVFIICAHLAKLVRTCMNYLTRANQAIISKLYDNWLDYALDETDFHIDTAIVARFRYITFGRLMRKGWTKIEYILASIIDFALRHVI